MSEQYGAVLPAMNVVIRYCGLFKEWFICHEKSYQNAFRSSVNGFKDRQDAVRFTVSNSCVLIHHDYDSSQSTSRSTGHDKQITDQRG